MLSTLGEYLTGSAFEACVSRISSSVQAPDFWFRTPGAPNEAGMLLMLSTLGKYLKGSAFEACVSRVSSSVPTPDFWFMTPGAPNEAGMLLMLSTLAKYLKGSAFEACVSRVSSSVLTSDFRASDSCSCERSRNVIDGEGHINICGRQGPAGAHFGGRIGSPDRCRI